MFGSFRRIMPFVDGRQPVDHDPARTSSRRQLISLDIRASSITHAVATRANRHHLRHELLRPRVGGIVEMWRDDLFSLRISPPH